uniref:Uncharacterized protein n=1 Tax=Oryza glaberrima TaxID=4538 RepID=I1QZC1_ORYGL
MVKVSKKSSYIGMSWLMQPIATVVDEIAEPQGKTLSIASGTGLPLVFQEDFNLQLYDVPERAGLQRMVINPEVGRKIRLK